MGLGPAGLDANEKPGTLGLLPDLGAANENPVAVSGVVFVAAKGETVRAWRPSLTEVESPLVTATPPVSGEDVLSEPPNFGAGGCPKMLEGFVERFASVDSGLLAAAGCTKLENGL